MNFQPTKQELVLVVMAFFVGIVLRVSHPERLAVEHFDEGVYGSVLWYDAVSEQPYPMRHLYAPPLLSVMIAAVAAVPGLQSIAPFLPAMILGSLSAIVLWWMARAWFGMTAGLVIVFLVAFSDFHVLFSRMALTDVPALFWICSSVAVAAHGLQNRSFRWMVVAGILTGLAWWTKYTGWLPVAIVVSGTALWWIIKGRKQVTLFTISKLLFAMIGVAIVGWLSLAWWLQDYGGYSAVTENHRGYFLGFVGWQSRLADHMVYHFRLDSWFGAGALGVGFLAAGTQRWFLLKRSTWNHPQRFSTANSVRDGGEEETESVAEDFDHRDFPSPAVLGRFIVAAVAVAVMACGIGTVGVLTCIGIGGMAGVFLWPVLTDLHERRLNDDLSVPDARYAPYHPADLQSAAVIDPTLAACLVLAWFGGMMLTTPLYHPYPQLANGRTTEWTVSSGRVPASGRPLLRVVKSTTARTG